MLLRAERERGIDAQEVRRALALLADPLNAIQLQYMPFHSRNHQTFAGTPAGLDAAVKWMTEQGGKQAWYYVLNPLPTGYSRQAICEDVLHRRWLLVDIDRNKAVLEKYSATDAEHEAARSLMLDVLEYLDGQRWPPPLIVDSGNGFQLLYRVDLPNNDLARINVKLVLDKLALRFNDERGTIGAECFDARRLAALPGTWKRSRLAATDRQHRLVKLIGGPG